MTLPERSSTLSYDEFEKDWLRRHRAFIPRKAKVSSVREGFWIAFWLVVAFGAAVFSAAHTIPAAEMTIPLDVPNRGTLAVAAFVIVELVIFGAAAGRHTIHWLVWLLVACVLVALVGNISSSVRAVADNHGDALNQVGGVLLSIIAPVTALAAGEVLHTQLNSLQARQAQAQADYDAAMVDVQTKLNAAWTRYEKEVAKAHAQTEFGTASTPDTRTDGHRVNGVHTLSAVRPVDTDMDGHAHGYGQGYSKRTDARTRVVEYLEQHPDAVSLTVRELAERTGVGKSVAAEVLREFKQRPQPVDMGAAFAQAQQPGVSTNGHREKDVEL